MCLLLLLGRASGGNDGKLTSVKIEIMSNESDCVLCLVCRVVALCSFLSYNKKTESSHFPTHQQQNATALCLKMKPITYLSHTKVQTC